MHDYSQNEPDSAICIHASKYAPHQISLKSSTTTKIDVVITDDKTPKSCYKYHLLV
jgi:hypothetical protein